MKRETQLDTDIFLSLNPTTKGTVHIHQHSPPPSLPSSSHSPSQHQDLHAQPPVYPTQIRSRDGYEGYGYWVLGMGTGYISPAL